MSNRSAPVCNLVPECRPSPSLDLPHQAQMELIGRVRQSSLDLQLPKQKLLIPGRSSGLVNLPLFLINSDSKHLNTSDVFA